MSRSERRVCAPVSRSVGAFLSGGRASYVHMVPVGYSSTAECCGCLAERTQLLVGCERLRERVPVPGARMSLWLILRWSVLSVNPGQIHWPSVGKKPLAIDTEQGTWLCVVDTAGNCQFTDRHSDPLRRGDVAASEVAELPLARGLTW